jgi:cobalt-precorrin-5B (C1)-methyltransferase
MPLWESMPNEDMPLKRGWTTGSCATAAAKAAFLALKDEAPDGMVEITLPGGRSVAFALAMLERSSDAASAAVIKDAGDDPDVTHGAVVIATVSPGAKGSGMAFKAGPGVGTVTKPGLPLPVGEPAINPIPRAMIIDNLTHANGGVMPDAIVTISIPGGEALAQKTLNVRLGIVGGLSILGTTGIVIPFSCAAWIHSIHRGIDVARGEGLTHIAGATGATSEAAVQKLYTLPDAALIDMGDFAGGMLKYLKRHPIARVTIAGGPAKMSKLAQGLLDLHSRSGALDLSFLAHLATENGAPAGLSAEIATANSGLHAFELARAEGFDLGVHVAKAARLTAMKAVAGASIAIDIAVFDREGGLIAMATE